LVLQAWSTIAQSRKAWPTVLGVSITTFDDIMRPGWAAGKTTVEGWLAGPSHLPFGALIIDRRGSVLRSSRLSLVRRRAIDKCKLAHELRATLEVPEISCCLFYERCAPMQSRDRGNLRDHWAGRLRLLRSIYYYGVCKQGQLNASRVEPGADPTLGVLDVVQEVRVVTCVRGDALSCCTVIRPGSALCELVSNPRLFLPRDNSKSLAWHSAVRRLQRDGLFGTIAAGMTSHSGWARSPRRWEKDDRVVVRGRAAR
jgi:hypothetical protein